MCGHGMRIDSREYNMRRPPPEELDFLEEGFNLLEKFSTGKVVAPDGGVFTISAVDVLPGRVCRRTVKIERMNS